MTADNFRDYMLSFLFLCYLSDNYEAVAKQELGQDYYEICSEELRVQKISSPLAYWYQQSDRA